MRYSILDINRRIDNIKSKEELVDFLDFLSKDRCKRGDEWENNTIEDYLASIGSWIEDMEGYYENFNLPMPANENWSFIATLFYVGKIYE
ncbi:MAG: hypothetical protein K2M78_04770 [Lachnospiraceae bacterium]|nr:hypothetical protein [Lachnospiraceae bacterium]